MKQAWIGDTSLLFLSLLVQGLPFLLIGSLLGAVVTALVPIQAVLGRWPRQPLLSALCGACCGLVLPACDCAVVPLVRRLIQRAVPLSAGVAYLLAAPVLNPLCLFSTYLAFRLQNPWQMVALRAGGSLLIAVVIGICAGLVPPARLLRGEVLLHNDTERTAWMRPRSNRAQFANAVGVGLNDFLNVATLYAIGGLISALIQVFLPVGKWPHGYGAAAVPLALLLAFLLSLCSSADAFVVNAFGALGLRGQMAFLWLGPVYNLRAVFVYGNVFRFPAICGLGLLMIVLVFAMNLVLGATGK